MSEQHTPELLQIADDGSIGSIQTVTGISIGHTFQVSAKDLRNGWPIRRANAARLVACWNACQGIDTADLKAGSVSIIQKLHDEAAQQVLAQRDELLIVLSRLLKSDPSGEIATASDELLTAAVNDESASPVVREQAAAILQARAAIANVEGGS